MIAAIVKKAFWKFLQALSDVCLKDKKLVLFGAFGGGHFGDNSGAFYSYLLKNNADRRRLVWMTDSPAVVKQVRAMGGEAFLKRSLAGIVLSLRAEWIVTSHGPEDVLLFYPRPGRPQELYLHHGIPVRKGIFREKKHFYEIPPVNSQERFAAITLTIATSSWAAKQQMNNIPVDEERIKITGLPRNDLLFGSKENGELKARYGLGNYVILYAPTWRRWEGTRFFPFDDLDLNALGNFLRQKNTTMILRPHHTDLRRQETTAFWEEIKNNDDVFKVITVFEEADVQPLLNAADCLITDYSSIHYDYLLTGRPIIYLPYDLERYVKEMGEFNCAYEQFTPGPKPKTQSEFLSLLEQFQKGQDTFKPERQRVGGIVHAYRDGGSCRRVYQLIQSQT